jgi:hypothetical protein
MVDLLKVLVRSSAREPADDDDSLVDGERSHVVALQPGLRTHFWARAPYAG